MYVFSVCVCVHTHWRKRDPELERTVEGGKEENHVNIFSRIKKSLKINLTTKRLTMTEKLWKEFILFQLQKNESKEHDGIYVLQIFNFKYLLEFVSVGDSCFWNKHWVK